MVTALDIEPNKLIDNVASKLQAMKLEKPEFVGLVKTGAHAERPPYQSNFWFIRCASILRQAYVRDNIGTGKLRTHYGGRKSRGVKPQIHKKAGGSTVRKAMQALEKAGLLQKMEKGRKLTPKGRKLLDEAAKESSSK